MGSQTQKLRIEYQISVMNLQCSVLDNIIRFQSEKVEICILIEKLDGDYLVLILDICAKPRFFSFWKRDISLNITSTMSLGTLQEDFFRRKTSKNMPAVEGRQ
jgi:hypothetical protein